MHAQPSNPQGMTKAAQQMHVAAIDIGKVANLGWVIFGPNVSERGTNLDQFINCCDRAMKLGPVALGFEAPMFAPWRSEMGTLDKGRQDENDRSFMAAAGACVLAKALAIVPYIVQNLHRTNREAAPTFKWREPLHNNALLLWEAFVTHQAGHVDDIGCAELAARRFAKGMETPRDFSSAIREPQTLNLLGAMLIRCQWSSDTSLLAEPCLVVRVKGSQ